MGTWQRIQVSVAEGCIELGRLEVLQGSLLAVQDRQLISTPILRHVHPQHRLVCFAYPARDRLEFQTLVCLIPMAA